ncbi:YdeI/OmpD-associated family protein [Spongiimicrobium salis]|uniref:YdeI/OmpD-associated family protein n=1 Tax=Spongiimicrobium salis TaxID=1667022 RepID=UPI00374D2271
MLKSEPFEVCITNTNLLMLPETPIRNFVQQEHKRVRVVAQFEKKVLPFYGSLRKKGTQYFILFGKSNQKKLGVFPNDYFQIQLFEDISEYGVEMPEELQAVLQDDVEAQSIFNTFTPGKKRSIIYMISRYRTSQTRIDKSILICKNLKLGIRDQRELLKTF